MKPFFIILTFFAFAVDIKDIKFSIIGVSGEILVNIENALSDSVDKLLSKTSQKKSSKGISDKRISSFINDIKDITKVAIQPYGYFNPVITKTYNVREKILRVDIFIDLKEPTRISFLSMTTQENKQFPADLLNKIPLKTGDIFNNEVYEDVKKLISSYYYEHGYINGFFSEKNVAINTKKNIANISIVFDKKNQFLINNISYTNGYLNNSLMLGLTSIVKNEHFSLSSLTKASNNFLNTKYFTNVNIVPTFDTNEKKVDILIETKEQLNHKYRFSGGYVFGQGLSIFANFGKTILYKNGLSYNVEAKFFGRVLSSSAILEMPILNPLKNKIFLEVFYQRLKLNNKFNHDLSFSFNYSLLLEGIKLTTSLKFLFPNIDFKNNIFNEITPFIEIRVSNKDSDNQYFADESINFSVMYRNTLGFIPINLKFSQIKIDTNFIKTMGKLRIVSKNTLGILVTDSIDVFPTSLSFFPDDRQFRLYSESQIGPGKFIYNFALNFQFNFYSDAYTITGFEIGDITNNSRVPKFIINVGVMYKTPIGQASISYAFPIFNSFFQDKDNKAKVLSGKVLLSIGAEF